MSHLWYRIDTISYFIEFGISDIGVKITAIKKVKYQYSNKTIYKICHLIITKELLVRALSRAL